MTAARADPHAWFDRAWRGLLLGLMTLFVVNIGLMIGAVATSSFARRWLGTWLPEGWTTTWYTAAWKEFQLDSVLWVTVEVVFAVVFLALLVRVRSIALFELTVLRAGPVSLTVVVALSFTVVSAGVRAPQSVDAMVLVWMPVALVWVVNALRLVDPSQLLSPVSEPAPWMV